MDELVGDTLFLLFTVTLPTGVASYLYKVDQIELHWAVVLTPFAVAALVAVGGTGVSVGAAVSVGGTAVSVGATVAVATAGNVAFAVAVG